MNKKEIKKVNETNQQYSELFKQACALLFPPGVTPTPYSMRWADVFLLMEELTPKERCD